MGSGLCKDPLNLACRVAGFKGLGFPISWGLCPEVSNVLTMMWEKENSLTLPSNSPL